jgi:hypothetical protein
MGPATLPGDQHQSSIVLSKMGVGKIDQFVQQDRLPPNDRGFGKMVGVCGLPKQPGQGGKLHEMERKSSVGENVGRFRHETKSGGVGQMGGSHHAPTKKRTKQIRHGH